MKKILLILLPLFMVFGQQAQAQVSYFDARVSEYGQLEQVLGDKWNSIDSLVVHGPVNSADFDMMWKCGFEEKMTVLNLENAQAEDNKIPYRAFFKSEKQVQDADLYILGITRIILPESIQEICEGAFMNLRNLKYINIPQSLRILGTSSFYQCRSLSTDPLIIPEGVTSIPNKCFVYTKNLNKVVLPSTVKEIGRAAFFESEVKNINLPEGLEKIGDFAFYACDQLDKVVMPNTVKEIGSDLFVCCWNMKEIVCTDNITSIPNSFAEQCYSLEKVTLPKNLKKIGDGAFKYTKELKSVDLPEGLEIIGHSAFEYPGLDSIVLPASVKYLGRLSYNLENVKKVYSHATIPPVCDGESKGLEYGPFGTSPYNIPVYVPTGTGELYRRTFGWNHFFLFNDILPTGIKSVEVDNVFDYKVYGRDGMIVIEHSGVGLSPVSYTAYSADGKVLERGTITSSHTIQGKKGCLYIVRLGNTVQKIRL